METLLLLLPQLMVIYRHLNSYYPETDSACLSRTFRDKMHFTELVFMDKLKLRLS